MFTYVPEKYKILNFVKGAFFFFIYPENSKLFTFCYISKKIKKKKKFIYLLFCNLLRIQIYLFRLGFSNSSIQLIK